MAAAIIMRTKMMTAATPIAKDVLEDHTGVSVISVLLVRNITSIAVKMKFLYCLLIERFSIPVQLFPLPW